jgi:hypothetical protein
VAERRGTARKILIWEYERGTLPYDILCALILLFVFLVPHSCLQSGRQVTRRTMPANSEKLPSLQWVRAGSLLSPQP